MSSSEPAALSAEDLRTLRALCERVDEAARRNDCAAIPDELVTALLTTATNLYRVTTLENRRRVPAFAEDANMTATSVVVVVSAMLRAVGLNSFDLAMWFNRPPDLGEPEG